MATLRDYLLEKLNRAYQRALKDAGADEEKRRAITNAQEAWLKFYEADSIVANWNADGGSGAYQFAMMQKIYQIRQRIYQLSTPFLQGWQPVPSVAIPKE